MILVAEQPAFSNFIVFRTISAVVRVRGRRSYPMAGVKPLGVGQEIGVGLVGDNRRLDPIHRDGFPSPRGRRSTAAAAPQQFWPDQLWSSAPSTAQSFHFLSNH
jgi:hypothetical protein